MVDVGWATGGGAAQILFSLFGDLVFHRGAAGIGIVWGCAGVGLLCGGAFAHWLGKHIGFDGYKRTIAICYVIHGAAYIRVQPDAALLAGPASSSASRARAVAVSSVLNYLAAPAQRLRRIPRPRLRDHRVADLGGDDAVDDGRRHRLANPTAPA